MIFYHKKECPLCAAAFKKFAEKNIGINAILVDPRNPEDQHLQYLLSKDIESFPVLELDNGKLISGAAVIKWINQVEVGN